MDETGCTGANLADPEQPVLNASADTIAEQRATTNRVRLKETKFLEMNIAVPHLDEQRRMVAKLDRVAALAEERRRTIDVVERDVQAKVIAGAPYAPIAEVAPLVRRPVEIEPDALYPELGVRSFARGPNLPGLEVGSKNLFEIREGDLLFNIVFAWEGAIAIAQPEDNGRVGSHRFLTCIPEPDSVTAQFLWFYFKTPEGLQKLGEASPGGAGRNRTLGLKRLEIIRVPVPDMAKQRWFDRLQARLRTITDIRAETGIDMDALTPAVLHEVFIGKTRTL
jgi:type I restriction enzyme S subunit